MIEGKSLNNEEKRSEHMAYYELKNDLITLGIQSKGAELKSLKKNDTGLEYLWHADPCYWDRTSPILFPVVGRYKNHTTYHEGREIVLPQHGFARDMEFDLMSQTEDSIWFAVSSNEETYAVYPFHFRLWIGYAIAGSSIKVMWKVENPDDKTLYFSIGAHPGFLCPFHEDRRQEEYFLAFDTEKPLESRIVGSDGHMSDETEFFYPENGRLAIKASLFDNDTMVIENHQIHQVSILTPEGQEYVKVSFDAPLVGIWTQIKKNAPFICIEPWYGRTDRTNFNQQLSEREFGQSVEPGDVFTADYTIEIH